MLDTSTPDQRWRSEVLRTHSARLLIETLLENPEGLTQRALHDETRLAQGTISNLVVALKERHIVVADKHIGGGRNREPQRWTVRHDAAYAIGVSIAQRRVSVVMLDAYGDRVNDTVRSDVSLNTLASRERTLAVAVGLIKRVVETPERCRNIAAVTVSLPGPVTSNTLHCPAAPTWVGHDIRRDIERLWKRERLPVPHLINVEKDANVAARGEMLRGAGRAPDCHSLLFVHWSSGIGAGWILNDAVWRGGSRRAGEIGHVRVVVDVDQQRGLGLGQRWSSCPQCNQRDCLQQRASLAALAKGAKTGGIKPFLAALADPSQRRHEDATAALQAGAMLVGRAIGPFLTVLDVDKVVIGGQIGREGFPAAIDGIHEGVRDTASLQTRRPTPIEATQLGTDATALGGALWALDTAGLPFLISKIARARAAA